MKACRIYEFGAPSVISFEEVERPEPEPDEVIVKVHAAGVGPWDSWIRAGKSVLPQPLPLTLGSDLSGRVVELGAEVRGFEIGQAVYGVTNPRFTNAYAEYAAAKAAMIAPKPSSVSDVDSASAPVVAVTALQMLFDHADLKRGQRVLVHGAGGSVGAFAVQLALEAGAQVIGTDVTQGVEYAASLGPVQTIDVSSTRFEQVTEPVDVVIDTVGGEVLRRSFAVLKADGCLISSVEQPNPEDAARAGVRAKFMLVDVTRAALSRLGASLDAGTLKARVGSVLPLADARIAHEMLDGLRPRTPGKIVLSVADGS